MSEYIPSIPRLLLFLLITLTSTSWVGAQSVRLPQPELITDRQGLPQAFVPFILQDKQGFIWAATRDGLCRYDGYRFNVFQPDPNGRPSLSFAGWTKSNWTDMGASGLFPSGRILMFSTHEPKPLPIFPGKPLFADW